MMTSKERDQLSELNGTAAPLSRDSFNTSSSGSKWKRDPTPIKPSANAPELHMVHQSGKNPYGGNPNRRAVGNPTSTQVLGRSNDPPPRKKVKTQHTPYAASNGPYTWQGDGNNARSKRNHEIPTATETIDVDDYLLMPDDNSHTNISISSPDELNIRSPSTEGANYPSKYQFDAPKHDSTVRNSNLSIVPDGENTEWAKKTYPQGSSNHSMESPALFGQVREEVAKIEAKTRMGDQLPPVIDLKAKLLKTKHKMKTKDNLLRQLPPFRAQPFRVPAKKKTLPLKGLYLDDSNYSDKLEIQWSYDKITIKSDKITIFGPFDVRANAHSLTYHDRPDSSMDYDPVFKLITIPGGKLNTTVKCLTVKLDSSSPGVEENYYTGLLDWLKNRVERKDIVRPSSSRNLWDIADGLAKDKESDFLTNQGDSGKNRLDKLRQGEPQRAMRSLVGDRSKPAPPRKRSLSQTSMKFTPPPSSTTVSDNPKPKPRSRQGTSALPLAPRRSTRNMTSTTRSPAVDSDEVILVYPPGVPGAVNITNGDFLRLQPEEFLNDTLIEFGLKLWLKELEQTKPVLASQIHVFNSFFYKKLNHQKKGSINLGYESVRKWTSKFDIFQKKYIIVPINEHLHWYFAIICDPEYVLVPTAPNASPSTRQKTRQSISESMITDEPNETLIASNSVSTSVSENGKDEDKLGTPSEAEVEDTLHDFQGSCSISNIEPGENVTDFEGGRSPSALSYVSDESVLRPLSPTASDHGRATLRSSPSDETMAMDGDLPPILQSTGHDDPATEFRSIDTARFYQPISPKRDKGKRKADPQPESFVMEIDDDDNDDDGFVPSDIPKTYIFTFDSLGGRHPQAINRLSAYLKMEAQDKKKVENPGNAEGKQVMVPTQPNFCDCGIYLLHFAQIFMSDPAHYHRLILTQKSKGVPDEERRITWNGHQVTDKREELRARIMKLSGEWKNERAAKEKAKHEEASSSHDVEVVESSDGEIDILEPTPSTSKVKSGGKKKSGQLASRLRG